MIEKQNKFEYKGLIIALIIIVFMIIVFLKLFSKNEEFE